VLGNSALHGKWSFCIDTKLHYCLLISYSTILKIISRFIFHLYHIKQ